MSRENLQDVRHGGNNFRLRRTRPGLYYASVQSKADPAQWLDMGDPIHGQPSTRKFKEALTHYGKLARRANGECA